MGVDYKEFFQKRPRSMQIWENTDRVVLTYMDDPDTYDMPLVRPNYLEHQSEFAIYLAEVDAQSTLVRRLMRMKERVCQLGTELEE